MLFSAALCVLCDRKGVIITGMKLLLYLTLFSLTWAGMACRARTLTRSQTLAASDCVRQLERVRVATQTKAHPDEYKLLLQASRHRIDEQLPNLPDVAIKQEIVAALEAYTDAARVRDAGGIAESDTQMLQKYDLANRSGNAPPPLPAPMPNGGVMPAPVNSDQAAETVPAEMQKWPTSKVVPVIWQKAAKHLDQASKILTHENRIF